jgi:PRC-barrel domain
MNRSMLAGCATLFFTISVGTAQAQIAGSTTVGVEVSEVQEVAIGWSAKKQILGRSVYNEKGERLGRIDDLIVAPDKALSFAIIGAGGFVGLGRHDVAIPVNQFHLRDGKLVLDGASRQVIRALAPFEYSNRM